MYCPLYLNIHYNDLMVWVFSPNQWIFLLPTTILPTICFFLSDRDIMEFKRASVIFLIFLILSLIFDVTCFNRSAYLSSKAPPAKPASLWEAEKIYQLQQYRLQSSSIFFPLKLKDQNIYETIHIYIIYNSLRFRISRVLLYAFNKEKLKIEENIKLWF